MTRRPNQRLSVADLGRCESRITKPLDQSGLEVSRVEWVPNRRIRSS